jgi:hypothetical protein
MFSPVRYLPTPSDFTPSAARRTDDFRGDSLVDLSLLLFVLNPATTPDEETVLRKLRAARVPERVSHRPRLSSV